MARDKTQRARHANAAARLYPSHAAATPSQPSPQSSSQETPARQKLRADMSQMSADRLRANWQKGITLAALSLAQQES
jgi:hypothetical protein